MAAKWKSFDLNRFLISSLPLFVTRIDRPGQPTVENLDVKAIHGRLEMSHEGVYKWLRKGKIKPSNAQRIRDLAHTPENVELLTAAGRTPPELADFAEFYDYDA